MIKFLTKQKVVIILKKILIKIEDTGMYIKMFYIYNEKLEIETSEHEFFKGLYILIDGQWKKI